MPIVLIEATPGPRTNERILELLESHPQGMTIRELSDRLNRPVSMLNHCLKFLISTKRVQGKFSDTQKQWIYSVQEQGIVSPLKNGRSFASVH